MTDSGLASYNERYKKLNGKDPARGIIQLCLVVVFLAI